MCTQKHLNQNRNAHGCGGQGRVQGPGRGAAVQRPWGSREPGMVWRGRAGRPRRALRAVGVLGPWPREVGAPRAEREEGGPGPSAEDLGRAEPAERRGDSRPWLSLSPWQLPPGEADVAAAEPAAPGPDWSRAAAGKARPPPGGDAPDIHPSQPGFFRVWGHPARPGLAGTPGVPPLYGERRCTPFPGRVVFLSASVGSLTSVNAACPHLQPAVSPTSRRRCLHPHFQVSRGDRLGRGAVTIAHLRFTGRFLQRLGHLAPLPHPARGFQVPP